jgi:hypothetical protein
VKDIDTLEARFRGELVAALRRAVAGRSPALFSPKETRAGSSAQKLLRKAERILELRQSYSVDHTVVSPAASYLAACLKWQQSAGAERPSVQEEAERLLAELAC